MPRALPAAAMLVPISMLYCCKGGIKELPVSEAGLGVSNVNNATLMYWSAILRASTATRWKLGDSWYHFDSMRTLDMKSFSARNKENKERKKLKKADNEK